MRQRCTCGRKRKKSHEKRLAADKKDCITSEEARKIKELAELRTLVYNEV